MQQALVRRLSQSKKGAHKIVRVIGRRPGTNDPSGTSTSRRYPLSRNDSKVSDLGAKAHVKRAVVTTTTSPVGSPTLRVKEDNYDFYGVTSRQAAVRASTAAQAQDTNNLETVQTTV